MQILDSRARKNALSELDVMGLMREGGYSNMLGFVCDLEKFVDMHISDGEDAPSGRTGEAEGAAPASSPSSSKTVPSPSTSKKLEAQKSSTGKTEPRVVPGPNGIGSVPVSPLTVKSEPEGAGVLASPMLGSSPSRAASFSLDTVSSPAPGSSLFDSPLLPEAIMGDDDDDAKGGLRRIFAGPTPVRERQRPRFPRAMRASARALRALLDRERRVFERFRAAFFSSLSDDRDRETRQRQQEAADFVFVYYRARASRALDAADVLINDDRVQRLLMLFGFAWMLFLNARATLISPDADVSTSPRLDALVWCAVRCATGSWPTLLRGQGPSPAEDEFVNYVAIYEADVFRPYLAQLCAAGQLQFDAYQLAQSDEEEKEKSVSTSSSGLSTSTSSPRFENFDFGSSFFDLFQSKKTKSPKDEVDSDDDRNRDHEEAPMSRRRRRSLDHSLPLAVMSERLHAASRDSAKSPLSDSSVDTRYDAFTSSRETLFGNFDSMAALHCVGGESSDGVLCGRSVSDCVAGATRSVSDCVAGVKVVSRADQRLSCALLRRWASLFSPRTLLCEFHERLAERPVAARPSPTLKRNFMAQALALIASKPAPAQPSASSPLHPPRPPPPPPPLASPAPSSPPAASSRKRKHPDEDESALSDVTSGLLALDPARAAAGMMPPLPAAAAASAPNRGGGGGGGSGLSALSDVAVASALDARSAAEAVCDAAALVGKRCHRTVDKYVTSALGQEAERSAVDAGRLDLFFPSASSAAPYVASQAEIARGLESVSWLTQSDAYFVGADDLASPSARVLQYFRSIDAKCFARVHNNLRGRPSSDFESKGNDDADRFSVASAILGGGVVGKNRLRWSLDYYYRILERICINESRQMDANFAFLSNFTFHRCLLASCVQLCAVTFKVSSLEFPRVLHLFAISAYDFSKLMEIVVRHAPEATSSSRRHPTSSNGCETSHKSGGKSIDSVSEEVEGCLPGPLKANFQLLEDEIGTHLAWRTSVSNPYSRDSSSHVAADNGKAEVTDLNYCLPLPPREPLPRMLLHEENRVFLRNKCGSGSDGLPLARGGKLSRHRSTGGTVSPVTGVGSKRRAPAPLHNHSDVKRPRVVAAAAAAAAAINGRSVAAALKPPPPNVLIRVTPPPPPPTTDMKPPAPPPPAKPQPPSPMNGCSLELFVKKTLRMIDERVELLCSQTFFDVHCQMTEKVYDMVRMIIIGHPELCFDRHLDSVVLCCVYGVSKVSPNVHHMRFRDLNDRYVRAFPANQRQVIEKVYITPDVGYDTVVRFYNKCFLPAMKSHLLGTVKPSLNHLHTEPRGAAVGGRIHGGSASAAIVTSSVMSGVVFGAVVTPWTTPPSTHSQIRRSRKRTNRGTEQPPQQSNSNSAGGGGTSSSASSQGGTFGALGHSNAISATLSASTLPRSGGSGGGGASFGTPSYTPPPATASPHSAFLSRMGINSPSQFPRASPAPFGGGALPPREGAAIGGSGSGGGGAVAEAIDTKRKLFVSPLLAANLSRAAATPSSSGGRRRRYDAFAVTPKRDVVSNGSMLFSPQAIKRGATSVKTDNRSGGSSHSGSDSLAVYSFGESGSKNIDSMNSIMSKSRPFRRFPSDFDPRAPFSHAAAASASSSQHRNSSAAAAAAAASSSSLTGASSLPPLSSSAAAVAAGTSSFPAAAAAAAAMQNRGPPIAPGNIIQPTRPTNPVQPRSALSATLPTPLGAPLAPGVSAPPRMI